MAVTTTSLKLCGFTGYNLKKNKAYALFFYPEW